MIYYKLLYSNPKYEDKGFNILLIYKHYIVKQYLTISPYFRWFKHIIYCIRNSSHLKNPMTSHFSIVFLVVFWWLHPNVNRWSSSLQDWRRHPSRGWRHPTGYPGRHAEGIEHRRPVVAVGLEGRGPTGLPFPSSSEEMGELWWYLIYMRFMWDLRIVEWDFPWDPILSFSDETMKTMEVLKIPNEGHKR